MGKSVRRFLVIASVESSPGTMYADSLRVDDAAFMVSGFLQPSISAPRVEPMAARLPRVSQAVGCIGGPHPPPSPNLAFEPVFELRRHPHAVDIDAPQVVTLRVVIAADRFARDDASESGFLLGFT